MGRANHLSKAEKELISMLYRNTDKSLGAIAKFLGRSKMSASRYQSYKLSKKIKPVKKTITDPIDSIRENLFKRVIDQCKNKLSLKFDEDYREYDLTILRNYIRRYLTRERKTNFKDLPEYKNREQEDILAEIAEIIYNKLRK